MHGPLLTNATLLELHCCPGYAYRHRKHQLAVLDRLGRHLLLLHSNHLLILSRDYGPESRGHRPVL